MDNTRMNKTQTLTEARPRLKTKTVTVIGMSDDGCVSLTAACVNAIERAQVLAGGERHLAFFPEFGGLKIPIKGKINDIIQKIDELSQENNVAVLASGDPLYFGIGNLLVKRLGLDRVAIIPHPGSVQLAFSRIGVNWEDAVTLSLHGRPRQGFMTKIQSLKKLAVFTDSENSPRTIAQHVLKISVCRIVLRPKTCLPPREESQVTHILMGASSMPSSFMASYFFLLSPR